MEREKNFSAPEDHPELEAQESKSLSEVWKGIKENISVYAGLVFRESENKELKKFEQNLDKSLDVSMASGEYLRFLIPQSLHLPRRDYEHEQRASNIDFMRQWKKDSIKDLEKESISINESEAQGVLFQTGNFVSKQEEGDNMIWENIGNTLTEDANKAEANIIIRNKKTGIMVDFGQMLPKMFKFVPAHLNMIDRDIDPETGKDMFRKAPVDLQTYYGTKNTKGIFSCLYYPSNETGAVQYGDITKKGGVLGLLHEISHTWQQAYALPYARGEFEQKQKVIETHLRNMAGSTKDYISGDKTREEYDKDMLPYKEQLSKIGVEADESQFLYAPLTYGIEQDEQLVSSGQGVYSIKSPELKSLMDDYAREERDAWAHAIRVLRFLRKKGIDIEPSLKSLEDIQEVIYPCLQTYQDAIRSVVARPRTTRFVRKKKHHKKPLTGVE